MMRVWGYIVVLLIVGTLLKFLGLDCKVLKSVIILSSKGFISCCLSSLSSSKLVFILVIGVAIDPERAT